MPELWTRHVAIWDQPTFTLIYELNYDTKSPIVRVVDFFWLTRGALAWTFRGVI